MPNSKGIVDVVFRVIPNRSEDGRTGGGDITGQCALLVAQLQEVYESPRLRSAVLPVKSNPFDQSLSIGGHGNNYLSRHKTHRRMR